MVSTNYAEAMHEVAVLALRIAAASLPDGSHGRSQIDLRVAQATGLISLDAAKAFLVELEGDWQQGEFSSQVPQAASSPRTKVLLDAAIDGLRAATKGDPQVSFPTRVDAQQGETQDQALGRQLREVGQAVRDRLRRHIADRKELVLSLEGLVEQITHLQGGGNQLGAELKGINEVVHEVSVSDSLSSNLRERLISRAHNLTTHMNEMQARISSAHNEVEAAQARIAGLEKQLKAKEVEARQDQLTGLPNRRALEVMLPEVTQNAHRMGEPLTLVMLDIDHFKRCNDTYGHRGGDAVLAEVAARLMAEMRGSDFAARYGGEEFILVLPGCSLILGQRVAERVRQAIARKPVIFEGKAISVTTSLGLAELRPKETPAQAIERADQALYSAKNTGRNRWVAAC